MNAAGQNLRINTDTGATIADGMITSDTGMTALVAAACTNNRAGVCVITGVRANPAFRRTICIADRPPPILGQCPMRLLLALLLLAAPATAQEAKPADDAAALAQTLTNPVASLISVPFQNNLDFGLGADGNGARYQLNVQPVVPITLNSRWNLISRTILPFISQSGVTAPGASQVGLGDTVQSVFFSPKEPTSSGIVWGAGPVLLVPTATQSALGTQKFGMGPTAVILRLQGQWTYGALANHIWSVAGKDSRADVSATFVQPFLSYTTRKATTYSITSETAHDHITGTWVVPINLTVSQIVPINRRPVSFALGARAYAESPTGGPDWGLRFAVTLLYPR